MSPPLDSARIEAFSGQMLEVLNGAAVALMTSIGHRTGLFDTMARLHDAGSGEIARDAKLNERYVREWLGCMVTARIVEHDATAGTYRLPPEHAATLTRGAGADNLASMMQWIACMGGVESAIVESFHRGGGVPYSEFERFHEIMSSESGQIFDETLVQRTLPVVPGLTRRLGEGIDVLDVGCGSGHAINLMAREFPKSFCTGYEFSEEGVARGRAEAESWRLANARFELIDVANITVEDAFDFITAFDAIHDQARPDRVLAGVGRALRPGGTFLMVDIAASSHLQENVGHPLAPFFYAISTMHCMTVSLARDGAGLGTMWGEQKALEMLGEAGFTDVSVRRVEGDIINNFYIARRE